jgi:hypothetical protein
LTSLDPRSFTPELQTLQEAYATRKEIEVSGGRALAVAGSVTAPGFPEELVQVADFAERGIERAREMVEHSRHDAHA